MPVSANLVWLPLAGTISGSLSTKTDPLGYDEKFWTLERAAGQHSLLVFLQDMSGGLTVTAMALPGPAVVFNIVPQRVTYVWNPFRSSTVEVEIASKDQWGNATVLCENGSYMSRDLEWTSQEPSRAWPIYPSVRSRGTQQYARFQINPDIAGTDFQIIGVAWCAEGLRDSFALQVSR